METDLSTARRSPLFAGIQPDEIAAMLRCLDARTRTFAKGETIFRLGDATSVMGLVLTGSVRLEREDYWGNRSVLSSFGPGQTFGEVYACEPGLLLDVNAVATEATQVMLLDVQKITRMCPTSCEFHARLTRNLLSVIARRTHALTRKIDHVGKRTTSAKLLSYLSDQAKAAQSSRFSIPFDRQELADYLSVDRSAMCTELTKLKKAGILNYRKNQFELL